MSTDMRIEKRALAYLNGHVTCLLSGWNPDDVFIWWNGLLMAIWLDLTDLEQPKCWNLGQHKNFKRRQNQRPVYSSRVWGRLR